MKTDEQIKNDLSNILDNIEDSDLDAYIPTSTVSEAILKYIKENFIQK